MSQRAVRELIVAAMIDWTKDYQHQNPATIGKIFRAVSRSWPVIVLNHSKRV